MKEVFFQILPYIQRSAILVSQVLISLYCVIYDILKWILEICIKNDSFFHKVFDKNVVKISVNKNSKKKIAYSTTRKEGLFMELEFRLAQCKAVHFKCNIRSEVVTFLSFRKNKEIKCISVEISKVFKRAVVSLSKVCRSKIFVT